jgi:hypothetical protein
LLEYHSSGLVISGRRLNKITSKRNSGVEEVRLGQMFVVDSVYLTEGVAGTKGSRKDGAEGYMRSVRLTQ